MQNTHKEEQGIEVVNTSALEQMERASIDVQIATAKKYPRVLSLVKAQMLSFATLDVETAEGCFFTLPARKGGDGKLIQGPSIRMAEIAISTYQNLRAGARIISDDGDTITAQGVCHDLQNNVCISVEVKRRVIDRNGNRYSPDMVVMTGNAACSIALRNATFRVVPLALVKPVYEEAKKVAVGDAKTLVTRRADALARFAKMGVPKEKVFAAVKAVSIEDIGLEQLEVLYGFYTAIKDGETSIDEVFNRPAEEAPKTAEAMFTKAPATAPAEAPKVAETPAQATTAPVQQAPPMESNRDLIVKMVTMGGVPFEMFVAEVAARNFALNTETWKTFADVPDGVFANLISQPKVMNGMIKRFGPGSAPRNPSHERQT